jgi:SAM-dependent methyltransferase
MSKDTAEPANGPDYVLGHSDREIARLEAQAVLIDPTTRRFLQAAGINPGMRVLDVGSGAGDVAFLAAELVGEAGSVVGVDRVPAAVKVAGERAASRALNNVTFREGDPAEISFDQPFDAVVGRYVLQFQKDPADVLRKLANHTRPGGPIVFHEIDWGGLASSPPVPTFDQCCRWGTDALRLHGTEPHMGTKLHAAFVDAGLGSPTMRLEAPAGGMPVTLPWLEMFKELIATLLPQMERLGVATAAQVGLNTLVERIAREATNSKSLIIGHYQVGAWVRRSAAQLSR